jgi:hypothetical protein
MTCANECFSSFQRTTDQGPVDGVGGGGDDALALPRDVDEENDGGGDDDGAVSDEGMQDEGREELESARKTRGGRGGGGDPSPTISSTEVGASISSGDVSSTDSIQSMMNPSLSPSAACNPSTSSSTPRVPVSPSRAA